MVNDTDTLTWALRYATLDWAVVPLWWPVDGPKRCACTDAECGTTNAVGKLLGSPGKHPCNEHGLTDATTDAEIIRGWWARWPQANLGLRTGDVFDVLDLDDDAAERALAIAADLAGEDTPTCWAGGPMVVTGRGSHIYYQRTGAQNTVNLIVTHVDWRGGGGYVVAPPSLHVSGAVYRWHDNCPYDSELEMAPAFLVAALFKLTPPPSRIFGPANVAAAIDGINTRMARAVAGERNHVLNWCAHTIGGKVRAGELDTDAAARALADLALVAGNVGLGGNEIEKTIASGFTAGRDGTTRTP